MKKGERFRIKAEGYLLKGFENIDINKMSQFIGERFLKLKGKGKEIVKEDIVEEIDLGKWVDKQMGFVENNIKESRK